jgi:hypothetical protein
VSTLGALAQNITRVTTLVVHSEKTNSLGAVTGYANATNQIYIAVGEAVRISSLAFATLGDDLTNFAEHFYVRDGWYWDAPNGTVVEGPVWFVIEMTADAKSSARMTLERWKVSKK